MSIEQEIRDAIERNKAIREEVGQMNCTLSKLENKCEQYMKDSDEAYQRGLDDAWEAARRVAFNSHIGGLSVEDLEKAFDCLVPQQVFKNYTAQQTIEKLKAYEEKQNADDKIEVRDEVVWTEDENVVIVVTSVYTAASMEWCDGVCKDGKVYSILTKNARKTGRRFDISIVRYGI